MFKTCTKCGSEKDASQFHRKTKASDGLNPSCKACVSKQTALHYSRNREVVKEKATERYRANREKIREAARSLYPKNREDCIRRASVWAADNRQKRREINNRYASRNRDRIREKNRAYQARIAAEQPEKVREAGRRQQAIRRSRVADAGGFICQESWNAIIELFEFGTCLYCGTYGNKLTMDHWVPVARGGKTEAGNLIPCCKSCNSKKLARTPDNWCALSGADMVFIELLLSVTKDALAA